MYMRTITLTCGNLGQLLVLLRNMNIGGEGVHTKSGVSTIDVQVPEDKVSTLQQHATTYGVEVSTNQPTQPVLKPLWRPYWTNQTPTQIRAGFI